MKVNQNFIKDAVSCSDSISDLCSWNQLNYILLLSPAYDNLTMALNKHPFRSTCLSFRAIESSDHEFFHALQTDPLSQGNVSPSLLAPLSLEMTTQAQKVFQTSLLGVLVCLPTTDENLALAGEGVYKKEDLLKRSLIRDELFDRGIPIGALSMVRDFPNQRHSHNRKGAISIHIAPKYQRKGYGREALEWALDWGFTHAHLHRIAINVFGWNDGALRLYQSIGFRLESRQKESWWHNGQWHDDLGLGRKISYRNPSKPRHIADCSHQPFLTMSGKIFVKGSKSLGMRLSWWQAKAPTSMCL